MKKCCDHAMYDPKTPVFRLEPDWEMPRKETSGAGATELREVPRMRTANRPASLIATAIDD